MSKRALEQQLYELLQDLEATKRDLLRARYLLVQKENALDEIITDAQEREEVEEMAELHGLQPPCHLQRLAMQARAELIFEDAMARLTRNSV